MSSSPPFINVRKQPRQARSSATVETILEASARILETRGLAAFTTNAVAERAGVSVGSLYQYFPTKEAILTWLIRRKREALIAALESERARADHRGLKCMVDGFVHAALVHQLERPGLSRSLEYAEATLPINAETEVLKRSIIVIVAEALSMHGIAEPQTSARDLAALTRGMADAGGLFGETDLASLEQRIRRAVYGYLGLGA
ncbi:MAG: TetR/AcrR family transcriptional regulator [Shinella sp.]|nr:MAG: TetR/AcrR family transcriptional regulator [Shinella sp.]